MGRPAQPPERRAGGAVGFVETSAFRQLSETSARVVLLAAPAGYGKTSLLRAMADCHAREGLSCAWIGPDMAAADRSLADVDIVLMDDAHLMAADGLFQTIRAACTREAAQCLLVATRTLPDADWLTLEAGGQFELLRPGELALTRNETRALLQHYSGSAPSPTQIDQIQAITEGWPIAAQWYGMLARKRGGWSRTAIAAPQANDDLGRYLNEMIFAELDHPTRDLLFDICDLGRFRADMLFDVGALPGPGMLNRLQRESLLVHDAGNESGHVRLNGLLQGFLESRRLETGRERNLGLLDKACQWAAARGRHADAVEFAIRGGRHDLAHERLARNCAEIVNVHGDLRGMLRWTSELHREGIRLASGLALWRVWALILAGELAQAERELEAVRVDVGQSGDPGLQLHADRLELSLAARRNPPEDIIQIAAQWLDRWGESDPFHLAATCVLRALAHLALGNVLLARRDMATAQRAACDCGGLYAGVWIAKAEACIGLRTGHLPAARDALLNAMDLVRRDGAVSMPILGSLHLLAARVFVELRDFTRAREHFASGHLYQGDTGLVEVHLAASEAAMLIAEEEGLEAAQREWHLHRQGNIRSALAHDCFAVRLLLRHGLVAAAREQFDTAFAPHQEAWRHVAQASLVPESFMPTLLAVHAQVLLAEGMVREADLASTRLLQAGDNRGNFEDYLAMLFVAAACAHRLGRRPEARRHLWRALRTAADRQMLQSALASCWPVQSMLAEYADVEEGLRSDALALLGSVRSHLGLRNAGQAEEAAPEALTNRESEVLSMLDTGLNSEEIASLLAMGASTVRWHIRNIYSKLGVRNRTGALARARRLGLIRDARST